MSDTNSFSATYKGLKNNVAILLKRLRSRDIVKTSEKANMPSPSINDGHAYNNNSSAGLGSASCVIDRRE